MPPIVERFFERPLLQRLGAALVLLGLIVFGWWQFYHKPFYDDYQALKQELEDLTVQVQKEQRFARNLERFKKEVEQLDKKLSYALLELPDKKGDS